MGGICSRPASVMPIKVIKSRDFVQEVSSPLRVVKENSPTSNLDIKEHYNFLETLGSGKYSSVRLAVLKSDTRHKFAVKFIKKDDLDKGTSSFRTELNILKTVDHPNIVKFYEAYQDENYYYLIMELCRGKDLGDYVQKNGPMTEQFALQIMRDAFKVVKYLHRNAIAHRDIKPRNFVMASQEKGAKTKLIDFGLSRFFGEKSTEKMKSVIGTPLTTAPEVFSGSYDERCDNWSLGVVMFYLLSGYYPFIGANDEEIKKKVMENKIKLKGKLWDKISSEAKDLIMKLMVIDPDLRITCSEALQHPWITQNLKEESRVIEKQILERIQDQKPRVRMVNEIMRIIVNSLTDEELRKPIEYFTIFDRDNVGFITVENYMKALVDLGDINMPSKSDVEELFKTLKRFKNSRNDVIVFSEFVCAVLDPKIFLEDEKLLDAFRFFDIFNTNEIGPGQITEMFMRTGRKISQDSIMEMFEEIPFLKCWLITPVDFPKIINLEPIGYRENNSTKYTEPNFDSSVVLLAKVKTENHLSIVENGI